MNKTYRLIWNDALNAWVAVSELTKAHGKRSTKPTLLLGTLVTVATLASPAYAQAPPPNALPTSGSVVAGSANITQSGAVMNITQSTQRAAIDWQSFNIGSGATVNFQQPGSNAVTLNRVVTNNPSQIFGSLNANGQIFLTNPSGVYFAPSASVNVGALVATTHSISNADFMAGNYNFTRNGATGSVINEGALTADLNGYIALLAPEVRNQGVVIAQAGTVAMAAGETITLQMTSNNTLANIEVEPATLAALVENGHAVQAPGGLIILSARAADQLQGSVVRNSGTLEASSLVERGGVIRLEADHITLTSTSQITATGATGGGEVYVGGEWQGTGSMHQATTVTMEQGAIIDVSATTVGDGGTAVLWSDVSNSASQTQVHGAIYAMGGEDGGDGGRIETSGHWLSTTGVTGSAAAPNGNAGLWLFDPYNITITDTTSNNIESGGTWTPSNDNSTIDVSSINTLLGNGTSVTVTTGSAGSQIGDINVASAITKNGGNTDVTLTLQAANSIVIDQAISNTGGTGKLHVVLDADNDNGTRDGGGIIILNNNISTGGGDITFGTGATLSIGGVTTQVGGDVYVGGSSALSLTTAGGDVTVNGEMLIANTDGLSINTSNGNVTFGGVLNSANLYEFINKTASAGTGSWDDARTEAKDGTPGGSAVGDKYLVTISSRLENAVASRATGYVGAWIGAYRSDPSTNEWQWADGPEAGQTFFIQQERDPITGVGGGTTVSGYYSNFGPDEPNGEFNADSETRAQFYGKLGQWNDLANAWTYSNDPNWSFGVLGFVRETNLTASPLTINAGSGNVTFSSAVGSSKALASLSVTSTGTIAINGGGVTTEGAQSYNGNVTLGSLSTILTQTGADTDFTVNNDISISNANSADASLTIKTTGNITLGSGSSITSSNGELDVVLWSDTDATNGGYIHLQNTSSITTNGGHLWLGGGAQSNTAWNELTIGDGHAVGTASQGPGILLSGTSISTEGGHIFIGGKSHTERSEEFRDPIGVYFPQLNRTTINSGDGRIWIEGLSQSTQNGSFSFGIQFESVNASTSHLVTSNAGSGDAITLIGTGSSGNMTGSVTSGIWFNDSGVLSATGGGNIRLTGTEGLPANGHSDIVFGGTGTINASNGDLIINANTLQLGTNPRLSGTGALIIQPRTANTTIGIGTGDGTLKVTSANLETNFVDGFSGITIGSATAGDITIGDATNYNDPLTLKTADNIIMDTNASLTGAEAGSDDIKSSLVLWADADGQNGGGIQIGSGASISTHGGNVVLAGGADDGANGGTANDGIPDGYAKGTSDIERRAGIALMGSIDSSGGDVLLRGESADDMPGGGHYAAVYVDESGSIRSGTGNIDIAGRIPPASTAHVARAVWLGGGAPATQRTSIISTSGSIAILGDTSGTGSIQGAAGILLDRALIETESGNISLTGIRRTTESDISMPNSHASDDNLINRIASTDGTITLNADNLVIDARSRLASTGQLVIQPRTTDTTIDIAGGAGMLTLTADHFTTNFADNFSNIIIGRSDGTGTITVGAIAPRSDLTLLNTTGGIEITGLLNAGSNTVTLDSTGTVTDTGSGSITAANLLLLGAGGSYTLDSSSNSVGTLAADTGSLSFLNSGALTIGTVNPAGITATGPVRIETTNGDITIAQNISTTNNTADAIVINAGKSESPGTATGGNIIISGSPTISAGAGGTIKLFSGSKDASTGLDALVTSAGGTTTYNADETSSLMLAAGTHAIYREAAPSGGGDTGGGDTGGGDTGGGETGGGDTGGGDTGGGDTGGGDTGGGDAGGGDTGDSGPGESGPGEESGAVESPVPPPPSFATFTPPDGTNLPTLEFDLAGLSPSLLSLDADGTSGTFVGSTGPGGISVSLSADPTISDEGFVSVFVPSEMATAGTGFTFPLPEEVFAGAGPDAVIVITTLPDGDPLPSWLSFDVATRTFIASAVPDGALPIQLIISVDSRRTVVVISARAV